MSPVTPKVTGRYREADYWCRVHQRERCPGDFERIRVLEARVGELTNGLAEMVNLHSGEDYRNRGTPMCPICDRNRKLLKARERGSA